MSSLSIKKVNKSFGKVEVLKNINIEVEEGEFVIFVGPSGCGKSTLLRVIAGLEHATSGDVKIAGELVNNTPPSKRGIAMVFQSYALYPHLSVRNNMSLGLKQAKSSTDYIKERVEVATKMLALDPYLDRHPAELSGGQRQRVAIGRAIVRKPRLFLFDEPLSNLDAALRVNTRLEIARLHRELDASIVYVTHDQTEAMTLADKIVVLQDGQVEQIGSPMELYNNPGNLFVAGFLGSPSMNFLDPELLGITKVKTVGLRPEHISLTESGKLKGEITHIEQLGGDTNVYVRITASKLLTVRLFGQHNYSIGSYTHLTYDEDNLYLFDEDDQRIKQNNVTS